MGNTLYNQSSTGLPHLYRRGIGEQPPGEDFRRERLHPVALPGVPVRQQVQVQRY
jgi:hypothetical protein